MLVLTQDYRGGGGGKRGGGGRGGEARCHARVRGQPLPGGMLEYTEVAAADDVAEHAS